MTDIGKNKLLPYLDRIITGDCITYMKQIPDNSVDLIIADPPYNLSKSKNWKWDNSMTLTGMGGNWNITKENWDDMPLSEYFNFTYAWLFEAKRVLKPTGSIWVFGTYHNIGIVNVVFQLQEIEIINEVIWYKKNSFPNLSGRRITASHENILWGHTGGKKRQYFFDYDYSKNGLFLGDELKRDGKQMRTVWDISNNKKSTELKYGKHPTQKPIKVLERMIKLSSKPEDIVLTPFSGSGSECLAAKILNRHFIGLEVDAEYCQIAKQRLEHAENDYNTNQSSLFGGIE